MSMMQSSISIVLIECLKLFNSLVSLQELGDYAAEVPIHLWTDELGRLRVWAANIGAHQTGQSSLDYRLRDASHIEKQTVKLLERLRRTLEDVDKSINGADQIDEGRDLTLDDDDDDDDETELQQTYHSLVTTIDCLFQMSMLIRRPAQHDRLLGTKKLDTAAFEPWDTQHVLHKFPRTDKKVVDRLGAAISRRRAALKYRERHHAKLQKGIDHLIDGQLEADSNLSDTIATDFVERNIDFDDDASNSGVSQTSYAPSLWQSGDKITVPRPPKESSNGKPFECPYCFFVVSTPTRQSWTRHVFRDLMPYVCVFPGCDTSNRLYDHRREWFQHIRARHMASSTSSDTVDCPLNCGERLKFASVERHLGRHLEELALFALPASEEGDEDGTNHSDNPLEKTLDSDDDGDRKALPDEGDTSTSDEEPTETQQTIWVDRSEAHNTFNILNDASFISGESSKGTGTDKDNDKMDRPIVGNLQAEAIDDGQGQMAISQTQADPGDGSDELETFSALADQLDQVGISRSETKTADPVPKPRKESFGIGVNREIDLERPTFIKVHRKYLLPETLDHYRLPWEWDSRDNDYIIIKQYVDHELQDELFEHSAKMLKGRERFTAREKYGEPEKLTTRGKLASRSRNVGFSPTPVMNRPPREDELSVMEEFERHARDSK